MCQTLNERTDAMTNVRASGAYIAPCAGLKSNATTLSYLHGKFTGTHLATPEMAVP